MSTEDFLQEAIKSYIPYEIEKDKFVILRLFKSLRYLEISKTKGILNRTNAPLLISGFIGYAVITDKKGEKIKKVNSLFIKPAIRKKEDGESYDFDLEIISEEEPIKFYLEIHNLIKSYFKTLEGISFLKLHGQESGGKNLEQYTENLDKQFADFIRVIFEDKIKDNLHLLIVDNDPQFLAELIDGNATRICNGKFNGQECIGNENIKDDILRAIMKKVSDEIDNEKINLILVDLKLLIDENIMLKKTGFELIKLIRNDKELKFLPIIITTRHFNEPTVIESLIGAGADWYYCKRFSSREKDYLRIPITFIYTIYLLNYLYYVVFLFLNFMILLLIRNENAGFIRRGEIYQKIEESLKKIFGNIFSSKDGDDNFVHIRSLDEAVFGYRLNFLRFIREEILRDTKEVFEEVSVPIMKGKYLTERKGLIEYFVKQSDIITDKFVMERREALDIIIKESDGLYAYFPLMESFMKSDSLRRRGPRFPLRSILEDTLKDDKLTQKILDELQSYIEPNGSTLVDVWKKVLYEILKEVSGDGEW